MNRVMEAREQVINYTVMVPVTETRERTVNYTVTKPVNYNQDDHLTRVEAGTQLKKKFQAPVDVDRFVNQVLGHSIQRPARTYTAQALAELNAYNAHRRRFCKKVWVSNLRNQGNQLRFATKPNAQPKLFPYTVTKCVPECRTKTVTHNVCKLVPECRQKTVTYTTCKMGS